jgi:hypothetical protein
VPVYIAHEKTSMTIFIGYGYNDRDKWVREMVYPIVRAFGAELVSGEVVHGQELTDGVLGELGRADAILAFLTRRADDTGQLTMGTHPWVLLEIGAAINARKAVIPVLEDGLPPQAITSTFQTVPYDPNNRDRCLVEIVTALGRLVSRRGAVLELLPEGSAAEIRLALRKPGFRAHFQVLDETSGVEGELMEAKVVPMGKGGLRLYASSVRPDAVLRIQVEGMGRRWVSDYKAVDTVGVYLEEQS